MRNDKSINELMNNPKVRNLGLKEAVLSSILEAHSDIIIKNLLENGYIELTNGMNIEIVHLTDRVHVLRGISYPSSRKYKLKLTMNEDLYQKIEKYYDDLQKEIG